MSMGKSKQSSGQTFDPELKGMLTSTFRTGQRLSQTPYQAYDAATVAPLSAAELEGMNMTANTARAGVGQAQMNQAITGAQAGMNFQPSMASAQTVGAPGGPMNIANQGVNAQNVTAQNVGQFGPVGVGNIASQGVNAQQIGALPGIQAQNVGGQTVQAQSLANTDLSPYQNQYTSGVIDAAMGDINRAREMTQNQNAASAVSAGAFGGDRQALVEAETNRNFGRQASDMAMNLRNQGFQNAQAAAQTDLNRAQDAGGQNAQSAMQAALANQQAGLSAGQQNQQLNFARQQANQQSALSAGRAQQASQQMAQMGLQSGLASQDANMRAALANQQAQLSASGQSAGNQLQASQLNAANNLAAQQSNQQAMNQYNQMNLAAAQGNQDAALRAALANQQAGLAGAGQRLQAGQNLANYGGDLRGMQFADAQALQGVGGQQRMAGQQLLDDRYRRFAEERDNRFRMFDVLRSGAGLLPNPLSSSSKGRSNQIGLPG